MVENMKKRKDWVTGDTFALPIKNSQYKEDNGKYLLFIYVDYDKQIVPPKSPVFRVKITSDKNLPRTFEEIESLEYIVTAVSVLEMELMISRPNKHQEIIDLQDEWGYLNAYQLEIWTSYKRKIPEDMIYIGNFQFTLPENEYMPYPCNIHLHQWTNVEERVMECYHWFNLKEWGMYDEKLCKQWHDREEDVMNVMNAYQKTIQENRETEEADTIKFEEKPRKRSTLTYVGGDPNHPDYKCCCKKKNTK